MSSSNFRSAQGCDNRPSSPRIDHSHPGCTRNGRSTSCRPFCKITTSGASTRWDPGRLLTDPLLARLGNGVCGSGRKQLRERDFEHELVHSSALEGRECHRCVNRTRSGDSIDLCCLTSFIRLPQRPRLLHLSPWGQSSPGQIHLGCLRATQRKDMHRARPEQFGQQQLQQKHRYQQQQ